MELPLDANYGPSHHFSLVNARRVVSADGVHVEFVSMHELEYRRSGRAVRLPIETYHDGNRVPDGVLVRTDDRPHWADGPPMTQKEIDVMMSDLLAASEPLRTAIRFGRAG